MLPISGIQINRNKLKMMKDTGLRKKNGYKKILKNIKVIKRDGIKK
jgi:hypothetical protein